MRFIFIAFSIACYEILIFLRQWWWKSACQIFTVKRTFFFLLNFSHVEYDSEFSDSDIFLCTNHELSPCLVTASACFPDNFLKIGKEKICQRSFNDKLLFYDFLKNYENKSCIKSHPLYLIKQCESKTPVEIIVHRNLLILNTNMQVWTVLEIIWTICWL